MIAATSLRRSKWLTAQGLLNLVMAATASMSQGAEQGSESAYLMQ
jgi:hypothetical protein